MMKRVQIDGLECVATVEADETTLRVSAHLTNNSAQKVFLFNVLHGEIGEDGVYPLDPRGAYVSIESDRVVVSRKIIDVPFGMFVEKRNIPFVTRLLPKQGMQDYIELPLPLAARSPYIEHDDAPKDRINLPVYLEFGFFFGHDDTESMSASFNTSGGARRGFEPFSLSSQRIARIGGFTGALCLIDRPRR